MKRSSFTAAVLFCSLLLLVAVPPVALGGPTDAGTRLGQRHTRAEITKLKSETHHIRQETHQIEHDEGTVGDIVKLAPLITALVALGGLIATLLKQIGESGRQRELDRAERAKALTQRLDEQFEQITEKLSATDGAARAAAAASIQMFMQPEFEEMHPRLFLLLLGTLRFPRGDFGDKLLVRTFQRVAPTQIAQMRDGTVPAELDFSNCYLERVSLSAADLSEIDMAFANLHGAELDRSKLWRARGFEVDLSNACLLCAQLGEARLHKANLIKADLRDARLVSTKLRHADATGADFRGAKMQEAQLDGGTLKGARFQGADLNNAYFRGATFDQGSLRSIARGAINWRKANWDKQIRADLQRISSESF